MIKRHLHKILCQWLTATTLGLATLTAQAQTTPATAYNALADLGVAVTSSGQAQQEQAPAANGTDTSTAVTSAQTAAQLLAWAPDGIVPGKTLWVGLRLTHQPHWHTYWKNSGDSGMPTTLDWLLPAGWQASEITWPTPKKFPLGPLANYGFDGEVLLPVAVTIGDLAADGAPAVIQANANWLACKTECIPEDATLQLTLPTQTGNAGLTQHANRFKDALARVPARLATAVATARIAADDATQLVWRINGLPNQWTNQPLDIFPEPTGLIAPGSPWTQTWANDGSATWEARTPVHAFRSESPRRIGLVLATANTQDGQPASAGVALDADFEGEWPAVKPPTPINPKLAAMLQAQLNPPPQPDTSLGTWLLALVGAFVGGLILNLMPCVFPVLALKVLAFAEQPAGADLAQVKQAHRTNGLSYTLGVVLSFGALGGALLALRGAGELLGWGFQLQNPWLVAGLAWLFTVIALNLFGLFEMRLWLPQRALAMRVKNPQVDAFLSGVLATAVASPCTAPFMGASLGLAIALPTAQAMAVFLSVGLGMASPYLLASWVPAVANRLPRPGAWMVTFKQLMGFPMLATVVWLLWVYGQQTNLNGAAALLLWLLAFAWLIWTWAQTGTRTAQTVWRIAGIGVLALASLAFTNPLVTSSSSASSKASASSNDRSAGELDIAALAQSTTWQAWSPERVSGLLDAQHAVFVDFSAAWCVTCQVNELTTLADDSVVQAFIDKGVVRLQADWTKRDPRITQALNALGRTGVPTYALYQPNQAPVVLSELITVADVTALLAQQPSVAPTR